jgi:cytochrome c-type biogenesis protein CcmH/NrfG
MPIIAVVGVATKVPWQTAITASSLNAVLMPAAVLCFVVLLNKKSFMGSETPKGRMRVVWNVSLAVCLVVMSIAAWFGLQKNWQTLRERLQPEAQVAMPLQAPESSETMPVAP